MKDFYWIPVINGKKPAWLPDKSWTAVRYAYAPTLYVIGQSDAANWQDVMAVGIDKRLDRKLIDAIHDQAHEGIQPGIEQEMHLAGWLAAAYFYGAIIPRSTK